MRHVGTRAGCRRCGSAGAVGPNGSHRSGRRPRSCCWSVASKTETRTTPRFVLWSLLTSKRGTVPTSIRESPMHTQHPTVRLADLTDDFTADPYSAFTALRSRGSVHHVRFPTGDESWLVVGHEEV